MNYDLFSTAKESAQDQTSGYILAQTRLNARTRAIAKAMGLNDPDTVSSGISKTILPVDECVLIKGDNLRALSQLLAEDRKNIDFCYIDPPYNTGQKFVYCDNRARESGTIWGKHHDWMTFMLPRLVAAHLILKETGIIAVSIDDYEYAHLKILMDSIFSSENHIATLVVHRSKNGKGSKKHVAVTHEYVVLYGKSSLATVSGVAEKSTRRYEKEDTYGKYTIDGLFRKKGDASLREDRPNMYYPLYYSDNGEVFTEKVRNDLKEIYPHDSKGIARRWLWGRDKAKSESWKLFASKKGTVYVKNYHADNKRVKLRSILDSDDYLTDKATAEVKNIFGEKIFETPKPIALISDLIDACCPLDGMVLDFFAGTGTTAEAVWRLNTQDDAHRKSILIEQNHLIEPNHLAAKRGFKCTSDITAFRLSSIRAEDKNFRFTCCLQDD